MTPRGTSESTLTPLLLTFDLKLVCSQCTVQENEITLTLKSTAATPDHQCARNVLIAKARSATKWRPVARRPAFPKPARYRVCRYFAVGSGCWKHKNRCSFARSPEEASVWTFEKQQRLDHFSFCRLVDQLEKPAQLSAAPDDDAELLKDLLSLLDVKAVCSRCSVQEREVTFTVRSISHSCGADLLLVKPSGGHSDQWRPVGPRPHVGRPNVLYQRCVYFQEDSGCMQHGDKCTFARSEEEASVWNFARDRDIAPEQLLRLAGESDARRATGAAEGIFQEFSGEFLELCGACFLGSPSRVTPSRGWGEACAAAAAHPWDSVLVHRLAGAWGKEVYNHVRPLPPTGALEYCSHVRMGMPCWHDQDRCRGARSEVEMAVWRAERAGLLIRPHLLRLSPLRAAGPGQGAGPQDGGPLYCRACLLVLGTRDSFLRHCASLEHAQIIAEDACTHWEGRPPPHNRRAEFRLCERPDTCEYGDSCPKAHSEEERNEWLLRAKEEREIRRNMEAQSLLSYRDKLLEEYQSSSNEVYVISEHVDDVRVSCDEELFVECDQAKATLLWHFHVNTERQLVHVALLKQEPGSSFSLDGGSPEPCVYARGDHFQSADTTYDVVVSFASAHPGVYEQWLVLDFDMRPVLLRKINVRVGQPQVLTTADDDPVERRGNFGQCHERWHRGNRAVIPCMCRTEKEETLLTAYKPPQMSFTYKATLDNHSPLTPDNYKERMHSFLFEEERSEDQVVTRLSARGEIITSDTLESELFGLKMAPAGELFCAVSVQCNLTPDTPEGSVLRRSIQSGLVAPLPSEGSSSKVYEAALLWDTMCENTIHLQLSKRCCADLQLSKNETRPMEVQFQVNRLRFCKMHKAVDLLEDTRSILPDFRNCCVPVKGGQRDTLNAKQQSAIDFIVGDLPAKKHAVPLLVYGPFGTGKTFTLATAARELAQQPQNKMLICTHTNSSADLYVKDYFHSYINNGNNHIRPLRIKEDKGIALKATDETTLQYCLLSKDQQQFLLPTKAVLDDRNIVITTTEMARHFHDLELPDGYFTHILIDEASQMLECEALIAIALAGTNTRLVLAGDHMQMGPKLFSVEDHQRSNHTLLTRLFHHYQGQTADAAKKSRIIFNENYRSTKEILEFVSKNFYVGKNDVIKGDENIPSGLDDRSLRFHHIRGECHLDTSSMSWVNGAEVAEVVTVVQDIVQNWPSKWGAKYLSAVCVLSEGSQVRQIRRELRKRKLNQIQVENIANVQGKQFRAVIISSVQTRESLKSAHLPGLELFNDARVLNTAMTRSQSQVVVVGDSAALCCFGKSSRIWQSYLHHCISRGTVEPKHLTQDFLESDVKEILRFQRPEVRDETTVQTDAILQQMENEDELTEDISELERELDNSDEHNTSHNRTDGDLDGLLETCRRQPDIYKRGQLIRESHNTGYLIPFDSPANHIRLKGKKTMKPAFSGDEVVLDIERNKIVDIIKKSQSSRILLCTMEDEDYTKRKTSKHSTERKVMIPLAKNAPKIFILVDKKRRNFIPVCERGQGNMMVLKEELVTADLKQNNVFMVEVITWKETNDLPLGKVIGILPIDSSLESALFILNEEFKVPTPYEGNEDFFWTNDEWQREDLCGIITFTVDPVYAQILDDAISVQDIGDYYELGVHIADVASFVMPGDSLDNDAKTRGATYYCKGKEPFQMFPRNISSEWSLQQGLDRNVVSLMFKVEKDTHEIIEEPRPQISWINSNAALSYECAEDIICERLGEKNTFDTVEDCVAVVYNFAKVQRKKRLLNNWAYVQTEEKQFPGKRKSHLMIEEISILFNSWVSKILIKAEETMNHTPLRCQAKPAKEKLKEFNKNNEEFIPLSFKVRQKFGQREQVPNGKTFHVLTKVWNDIQSAAREDRDWDKIIDLIAADDLHPQLLPVLSQFRKCLGKAFVVRSNSSPKADIGHYSLKLPSYTQASSPIRRYIDIVLQRLLYTVICGVPIKYSQQEIDMLCQHFELSSKTARDYEQKAEMISYAVNMKKQSASKLGFVVCVDSEEDRFKVSFPLDKNIFQDSLPIMYGDLQLQDQPLYDSEEKCMTLKWQKRMYSFSSTQIRQEVKRLKNGASCTQVPLKTWQAIVKAIDEEKWGMVKSLILSADTVPVEKRNGLTASEMGLQHKKTTSTFEAEHYVDLQAQLRPGDTIQVQLTSEVKRGYLTPTVQLVCINPKFELCVYHTQSPITCFSTTASCPSRTQYNDTNEYVRIWKILCEMESAANAVNESGSIIIEDLVVDFQENWEENYLKGSFKIPSTHIKDWAIECNLAKCLLCIRKRGLPLTSTDDHFDEVDPSHYTWVAHGVTYNVEEVNEPLGKHLKVDFYVNHLPMEQYPVCVFKRDVPYTVELIPKLLPDIRKETAVVSIPDACDLVKGIALRQRIPRGVQQTLVTRWQVMRQEPPNGLPRLNTSQFEALEKAVNENFTLIQGPPGTGKTVVGAYIVYWFCKLNSMTNRISTDPKDQKKKDVILYCGPSNKSVDVVSEYLLRFGKDLKPLRVYSQQVEMLDYPYPGCALQFSQQSQRQERSKQKLRSITMHHRMREDQNPFSGEIKAFDNRIQLALEDKDKELTDEEVEAYKNVLIKARIHEFSQHDIILCTCTAASNPGLTRTISARQILIDECAMATEPQALIPLVCNKPEKIVLLGDHKQLRPIVRCEQVRKLGMSRSLFESYFTLNQRRTVMLDTQYRMHKEICQFPSEQYYDGRLKTEVTPPESVLLVANKPKRIIFGDIRGEEKSLVVSTEKGNENSKANSAEKDVVVKLAKKLVENAKISPENIVILSPYNAQVSEIRACLLTNQLNNITVTTITKSQGSEWSYVIISTVRSLPSEEIEKEPEGAWLSKHVGFVGDPNQINVGITRAKVGLCIVGNQELLSCSNSWKPLLNHYKARSSVTKAENICVRRSAR